jgi:hypothetical protein
MSFPSPSSSSTDSRRGVAPGSVVQSWCSAVPNSNDSALAYDKTFVTDVNPDLLHLAALERSRAFLLEYLNPKCLLFFRVSIERNDYLPHSSILIVSSRPSKD